MNLKKNVTQLQQTTTELQIHDMEQSLVVRTLIKIQVSYLCKSKKNIKNIKLLCYFLLLGEHCFSDNFNIS